MNASPEKCSCLAERCDFPASMGVLVFPPNRRSEAEDPPLRFDGVLLTAPGMSGAGIYASFSKIVASLEGAAGTFPPWGIFGRFRKYMRYRHRGQRLPKSIHAPLCQINEEAPGMRAYLRPSPATLIRGPGLGVGICTDRVDAL